MPKRGDLRQSDGRIFWGYYKGKEDWRNPSSYCVSVVKRRDRNKKLRDIRGRWLDLYKMSKGCEICGYDEHPVALHFDHLKKADKVMDISNMKKGSLKKLIAEVRKCRVLCANCHAIHSKNQRDENEHTNI